MQTHLAWIRKEEKPGLHSFSQIRCCGSLHPLDGINLNKHIFSIFSDGVQLPMVSLVFVHQKLINGIPQDKFSSTY
jgi:hypothetical protein